MKTIDKSDAAAMLSKDGYPCELVDGVIVFTDEITSTQAKWIRARIKEIGYRSSYGMRIKVTARGGKGK